MNNRHPWRMRVLFRGQCQRKDNMSSIQVRYDELIVTQTMLPTLIRSHTTKQIKAEIYHNFRNQIKSNFDAGKRVSKNRFPTD